MRRVRHPILRLEVLAGDGTSTTSHFVFCRQRRASVAVGECIGCVHCDAITSAPTPSVDCSIEVPASAEAPDPEGQRTEVATLLADGATVIEQSATIGDAIRLLRGDQRRSIAIVDTTRRLVGMVHEMTVGTAGQVRGMEGGDVTVAMTTALAIEESTPVRIALHLLASSHLRDATVVRADGTPLGVFRDVDGLRWIARARTGADDDAFAPATDPEEEDA